jgi:hypothetical protein
MIEAPEKQYVFHSTNNERVNEVRREAMQGESRQSSNHGLANGVQNVRVRRRRSAYLL